MKCAHNGKSGIIYSINEDKHFGEIMISIFPFASSVFTKLELNTSEDDPENS